MADVEDTQADRIADLEARVSDLERRVATLAALATAAAAGYPGLPAAEVDGG